MEFGEAEQTKALRDLFSIQPATVADKVNSVKDLFVETGAAGATREAIHDYTQKAFSILDKIDIASDKKAVLRTFGTQLMAREV